MLSQEQKTDKIIQDVSLFSAVFDLQVQIFSLSLDIFNLSGPFHANFKSMRKKGADKDFS